MSARNYSLVELVSSPSFIRWVSGEATEEERKHWDRWIAGAPGNRALAKKAQEQITGFSISPAGGSSAEQAWHRIELRLAKRKKARTHSGSLPKGFKNNRLNWLVRIAAGFLVVALTGYLVAYFYQSPAGESTGISETEVRTDYGEQKTISLSDGSEIILNGNSRMLYHSVQGNPAAIDLFLEGEAYFSVSKRDRPGAAPFQVRTREGVVKVLGTRFVVSAYNNRTRVIVEEGKTALYPSGMDEGTELQPGQLGRFSGDSRPVQTEYVDPEIYTSWTAGRLYFKNTPLPELADRLERTFGVKVVLRDAGLRAYQVSGSIESSTLEIITSALSEMLRTSIEKSDSGNVIYVGDPGE